MKLKGKSTSIGYVEIRLQSDGWYGLYVNGQLKEQSADLHYIESQYAKY